MAIRWLHTDQYPSVHGGRRKDGWRAHAVEHPTKNPKLGDLRYWRAACGLLPRHGWCLDLFVEDQCERCERKLGIESEATKHRRHIREAVRRHRPSATRGE